MFWFPGSCMCINKTVNWQRLYSYGSYDWCLWSYAAAVWVSFWFCNLIQGVMTSFGYFGSLAWTWPALGIQRVVREERCVLGFDTSRASSDSRGCPAALWSRMEVSDVVTWSPSAWLAMAGRPGFTSRSGFPQTTVKHHLRTDGWKERFLFGTEASS